MLNYECDLPGLIQAPKYFSTVRKKREEPGDVACILGRLDRYIILAKYMGMAGNCPRGEVEFLKILSPLI